jgi:hypothetical protein
VKLDEGWATIIAAVGGALVTLVGTFLFSVSPERKKRRTLLADYLDGIAGSMDKMVQKFRAGQIPREDGHYLDAALGYFDTQSSQRLLSGEALRCIKNLKELSAEADEADGRLDRGDRTAAESWIKDAERVMGETKAEADKLRLG